jgi:3-oxoadipate enol-lactonase
VKAAPAGDLCQVALGPTRLTYRRFGPATGPIVLLLHPWFGCWRFWEPVLPALTRFRCLVPDLYSPADGPWTAVGHPEGLARGLVALLDAEQAGSCAIAGNSMGGILGQLLAAAAPTRVRKLVLVGTGARSSGLHGAFQARLAAWLESLDPVALTELTRGLVAPRAARHPIVEACIAHLADVDPRYLAEIPTTTMGLDLRTRIGAVTAQTLVIRGELDAIRTRAHAQELARAIRGARLVEMAAAGHSPMIDSTAQFNRLLTRFLDS